MKKLITFMTVFLVMCMACTTVLAIPEEVEGVLGKEMGPDGLAMVVAIVAAAVIMGSHYLKCYKRNQYVYNPGDGKVGEAVKEIKRAVKDGIASKAPQNFSQGNYYSTAHNASNPAFEANQHMMDEMARQFNQQSMDFAMEEARKAATPFDHGGYQQGYGVNPSDTMAGDLNNMMNNMNNMNNSGGMGF